MTEQKEQPKAEEILARFSNKQKAEKYAAENDGNVKSRRDKKGHKYAVYGDPE